MAYEIIYGDGIQWARDHPDEGAVVTSAPDPANMIASNGTDPWRFFRDCIRAAFATCRPDAPAIFIQTDRRENGTVSKAEIAFEVARECEMSVRLLWHKIALTRGVNQTDLHRPTYTHVLAFGTDAVGPGDRTPDVFRNGPKIYKNGTGLETAERTVRFAGERSNRLVDPFCGRGTIPVMADALGYDAVGIDADDEQVAAARNLTLRQK